MQDTTNFVEEMVLPLGNIEDVQLVVMQKKKNERGQNDENMPQVKLPKKLIRGENLNFEFEKLKMKIFQTVWALILSSTGLFYEHEIVNVSSSPKQMFNVRLRV